MSKRGAVQPGQKPKNGKRRGPERLNDKKPKYGKKPKNGKKPHNLVKITRIKT